MPASPPKISPIEEQIAAFHAREAVRGVRFEELDGRFRDIFPQDAFATVVASGFLNTEGPVWTDDGLLFVDPARNRIARYRALPEGPEVTTYRYPSGQPLDEEQTVAQNGAMGLTLDIEDRLLACETGSRRVTRTEANGDITIVADAYEGRRLNRPNDVTVDSAGVVYFTDPAYLLPTPTEKLEQPPAVYRVAPCQAIERLADDMGFPNGLALSPDERTLYVADSDNMEMRIIDLDTKAGSGKSRPFARMDTDQPGVPDGIKVDVDGNVYCGSGGGLWVFGPDGVHLGTVVFPDWPRNLAWGDRDWRTLYVTAGTTVYRIRTAMAGIPVGAELRRHRAGARTTQAKN